MTQFEINIQILKNCDSLFVEPDYEGRPQGLHNKWCDCPWCVDNEKEEEE